MIRVRVTKTHPNGDKNGSTVRSTGFYWDIEPINLDVWACPNMEGPHGGGTPFNILIWKHIQLSITYLKPSITVLSTRPHRVWDQLTSRLEAMKVLTHIHVWFCVPFTCMGPIFTRFETALRKINKNSTTKLMMLIVDKRKRTVPTDPRVLGGPRLPGVTNQFNSIPPSRPSINPGLFDRLLVLDHRILARCWNPKSIPRWMGQRKPAPVDG